MARATAQPHACAVVSSAAAAALAAAAGAAPGPGAEPCTGPGAGAGAVAAPASSKADAEALLRQAGRAPPVFSVGTAHPCGARRAAAGPLGRVRARATPSKENTASAGNPRRGARTTPPPSLEIQTVHDPMRRRAFAHGPPPGPALCITPIPSAVPATPALMCPRNVSAPPLSKSTPLHPRHRTPLATALATLLPPTH
ncbi:MAG: hypothetical protein J3K34DRAFT_427943, partial [Monoraphidium minutum]